MENKKLKILSAKVISNKMDKSATVAVERLVKHPVNGKYIKRTSKFHIPVSYTHLTLPTNSGV